LRGNQGSPRRGTSWPVRKSSHSKDCWPVHRTWHGVWFLVLRHCPRGAELREV